MGAADRSRRANAGTNSGRNVDLETDDSPEQFENSSENNENESTSDKINSETTQNEPVANLNEHLLQERFVDLGEYIDFKKFINAELIKLKTDMCSHKQDELNNETTLKNKILFLEMENERLKSELKNEQKIIEVLTNQRNTESWKTVKTPYHPKYQHINNNI